MRFNRHLIEIFENKAHVSKHQILQIFKKADLNGDKRINYEEFENIVTKLFNELNYFLHFNAICSFFLKFKKNLYEDDREVRPIISSFKGALDTIINNQTPYERHYHGLYRIIPLSLIYLFLLQLFVFLYYMGITDNLIAKNEALFKKSLETSIMCFRPDKPKEFWRFLTYMSLHVRYFFVVFFDLFLVYLF